MGTHHLASLLLLCALGSATGFLSAPWSPSLRRVDSCQSPVSADSLGPRLRAVVGDRFGARRGTTSPVMMKDDASEGDLSDEALAGLYKRVAKAKSTVTEVPLIVMDSMVPRQKLKFSADPQMKALIVEEGIKVFGMLAVDPVKRKVTSYGSTVEIQDEVMDGDTFTCVFVARKRFKLLGDPWKPENGSHVMSKIEYVDDMGDEETDEGADAAEKMAKIVAEADREADLALSEELEGLVDRWKGLVVSTGREREPNQIDKILMDIGDMPPADKPFDRALWVAALINPLPALGVSLEIRPAVLCSPTASNALQIVHGGLTTSIAHLDGSKPMW
uniref:Lon N-terminal domain-containing protein n=1 Tax=Hemiselmis andersenii TaxID=464988 RepID=A0A6T8L222_HEMAN|mmetsp:Transcript_25545/g.59254  ORF Transcript_25545/g.59254 Transcript_25545/m.59254 type:complete len:332 (+) Transcript_25545:36-1031(+)|eukprot:CAMPEP_0114143198 /NCGR_PEP_ID=MMETSP0043_2-20121206/18854_1 /TAXON_ID=464988 /ORGANISM="Hemiselmis andersenii, Strain CCMP644" /LENGTH=331 /DNA_ID=CAMNT_0001237471 /DNA_START=15 /DNA_END=1013 /DNA_ORIENTATION=+